MRNRGVRLGPSEQRVRIALTILQARGSDRPVHLLDLEREIPELSRAEIQGALDSLRASLLVQEVRGGWLARPPPVGTDATHARAQASRVFRRGRL